MTYRAHIKNGVAVLDSPAILPDGTPVRVEMDPAEIEFWHGKSLAELAREQAVSPIDDPAKLAIDWPADDSVDEFLILVREARR